MREVLDGVLAGQDVDELELVDLFAARGAEVAAVAEVADELRRRAVGDEVTFVVNRSHNYTNVCTFRCTCYGFSKGPLSLNLRGKPYLLTLDDNASRVREAVAAGATEVCLQGGIHPSFDGSFYLDVARAVRGAAPEVHVHGFTALEVFEGARGSGWTSRRTLRMLQEAGLRSLPGTAAAVLDDEVRAVLCPDRVTTDVWLEVHRTAHAVGLRSNIALMFNLVERPVHWARHLRTRALQRETSGFTEFVPLPFVHMAAPVYLKRGARRGPTWREVVLVHAVPRTGRRSTSTCWPASRARPGVRCASAPRCTAGSRTSRRSCRSRPRGEGSRQPNPKSCGRRADGPGSQQDVCCSTTCSDRRSGAGLQLLVARCARGGRC